MDPAALRILAHPLRARILAELRLVGPATSADLARALDTHTGATSYHLRRLAEAGLVADTGTGRGRSRIWQARTEGLTAEPVDTSEDDEAALEWLSRDYIAHFADRAQDWITRSSEWTPGWQEASGLDDHLVLLTEEQLADLRARMGELLGRYRRMGAGNPRAKRVVFYTCAIPIEAIRR